MGTSLHAEDRTLSSRYECKYLIPPRFVPAIRQFITPFLRPDRYALGREGYRYTISSLYLDTPDLRLFHQTVKGEKNRFKLRIRTYSDAPNDPVFFEIKKRCDRVIRKRRAKVCRTEAMADDWRARCDGHSPGTAGERPADGVISCGCRGRDRPGPHKRNPCLEPIECV